MCYLKAPVLLKEFGAIDYIDVSPVHPHNFAVTCSVRVQIYNPITKLGTKNLSRFQKNAYGGTFGKDGRLLVAGDDEGLVKLFDTSSKSVLRLFQGHKAGVHRVNFTSDKLSIASFSDDKTVKLWDIASEQCVQTFDEHQDYIRAGCTSPVSPDIILSGGYDHHIKMYDTRSNTVIFDVDHGHPVESLLFLPTGGIFISAGGTCVNVWDAFAGGKLIASMSQHNKTVTCLRLASNGRRLMSGSLDRKVKIYDIATYEPVHTLDFPNAVLSLGVSPNKDDSVVVGMVDGFVSIQRMEHSEEEAMTTERRNIPSVATAFELITDYTKKQEAKYDKWLRKFEYTKALDEVLLPYVVNKNPHVTVALMKELIRRKGLERALIGRSDKSLGAIIRFLIRYMGDHRFTRVLIDVANILLNVYEDNFSEFTGEIGKQFLYLSKKLSKEEAVSIDLLRLHGTLELILAGAGVADEVVHDEFNFETIDNKLKPSVAAKASFVVSLNE